MNFVKMAVFALMGLMAAVAGLTTTARLAAGTPSAGFGGELDAIASCFIGGTSMRGGVGSVIGALVGALIMSSLDNGMSMLGSIHSGSRSSRAAFWCWPFISISFRQARVALDKAGA